MLIQEGTKYLIATQNGENDYVVHKEFDILNPNRIFNICNSIAMYYNNERIRKYNSKNYTHIPHVKSANYSDVGKAQKEMEFQYQLINVELMTDRVLMYITTTIELSVEITELFDNYIICDISEVKFLLDRNYLTDVLSHIFNSEIDNGAIYSVRSYREYIKNATIDIISSLDIIAHNLDFDGIIETQ